jgi:hypothetical protein
MNKQQIITSHGIMVYDRLVKEIGEIPDYSHYEVSIIVETMEDERKERYANRELARCGKDVKRIVGKMVYTPISYCQGSTMDMIFKLYESKICPLCILLGGVGVKRRGEMICYNHISEPPIGFKCKIYKHSDGMVKCGYKSQIEGICPEHGIVLEPYWPYKPDFPEFLKDKKRVKRIIYAQLASNKGKIGVLDVLDKIGELYNVTGSKILELVKECVEWEAAFKSYGKEKYESI